LIYKVFLLVFTAVVIVYLFPKGSKFKYELTQGKPWQYETLYAPFDFAIQKSEAEIKREKEKIKENHTPYFNYNISVADTALAHLNDEVEAVFNDSILDVDGLKIVKFGKYTLKNIYKNGVIKPE